jgi:hypothetical protein
VIEAGHMSANGMHYTWVPMTGDRIGHYVQYTVAKSLSNNKIR